MLQSLQHIKGLISPVLKRSLLCVCVYLDDKGLVLEAGCQAQHAHVGRLVDEVLDAVENSASGG